MRKILVELISGMKRRYICLSVFFTLLLPFSAMSQTVTKGFFESSVRQKNLDSVVVRVIYEQSVIENTQQPSKVKKNTMLLEIGNHMSKYYDQTVFMADSLFMAFVNDGTMSFQKSDQYIRPLRNNSIVEHIFKNYPADKITITDRIPFSTYIYTEVLTTPEWQLEKDSSKTIIGYVCLKAATFFRGRNYTAWYTPDIPISESPWKFRGLPGLILQIQDDKKEYVFECVGLEKPRNSVIYFKDGSTYISTTKDKFIKSKKEFMKNPGAHIESTGMVFSPMPPNSFKARPDNPIELSD